MRDAPELNESASPHRINTDANIEERAPLLVTEASPLRMPPKEFSRRQVLYLDGIRYAAEMARIAYERLFEILQGIAASQSEPRVCETATAMLDAWSIVDSANRFRVLVDKLPGLRHLPWTRLLQDRTTDVATLRDAVQHQLGEVDALIAGGEGLWGYLSWNGVRNGRPTSKWLVMNAGSEYVGDERFFIGPSALPFPVPPGRIRLNAFTHRVYLGRTVMVLEEAVRHIASEIREGRMRPIGPPAVDRRHADSVAEGHMCVIYSSAQSIPSSEPEPNAGEVH